MVRGTLVLKLRLKMITIRVRKFGAFLADGGSLVHTPSLMSAPVVRQLTLVIGKARLALRHVEIIAALIGTPLTDSRFTA